MAVTSENDHLDRSGKSVGGPGEEPTVRIDMRFLPMPEAESTPVFSDLSGRKRRRLRWLAIGAAMVCTTYLVLMVMSIAGGANGPNGLLPLPNLIKGQDHEQPEPVAVPSPAVTPGPTHVVPLSSDDGIPDRAASPRPSVTAPATVAATAATATTTPTPHSGTPAPTDPAPNPPVDPEPTELAPPTTAPGDLPDPTPTALAADEG